jgi:hypothetical protein
MKPKAPKKKEEPDWSAAPTEIDWLQFLKELEDKKIIKKRKGKK